MMKEDLSRVQNTIETGTVDSCDWWRVPEPCTIIIFGASGDLTCRKIIPALYNLFINGGLSDRFCVLGIARTPMNDDAFREKTKTALLEAELGTAKWSDFSRHLRYQQVFYDDPLSYDALSARLKDLEYTYQTGGNRLFSLAIPPALYATVARRLGRAGLAHEDQSKGSYARLVVEKPFGHDLPSSKKLNEAIGKSFKEHQVFRIDHYMTKQTVQNILVFRFANAIFEPLWNRNYIDHVRINASESLGVEHRSGYYDRAGVLRDMFQNHMMELLALVAAEPPSQLTADRLRDKKAELLRCLRPIDVEDLGTRMILGQYEDGRIEGKRMPGYRKEPGVKEKSNTPTYGLMQVYVDNWRWQGVPFYITSGKRMRRKITRIDIQFKAVPHSMFRATLGENISANRLVISVYPQESIFLNFQAMRSSAQFCLRTAGLHFSFHKGQKGPKLGAYEIAFADVMSGDQTLFWRQDCLELSWAFFNPVLDWFESYQDQSRILHGYPSGSFGPQAALDQLPPGSWPEKPL